MIDFKLQAQHDLEELEEQGVKDVNTFNEYILDFISNHCEKDDIQDTIERSHFIYQLLQEIQIKNKQK